MLLAAHYAGVGQQTGTGVGAVHAIGHAIGTRGRIAHGTALATVMPEVSRPTSASATANWPSLRLPSRRQIRATRATKLRAGIDAVERLLDRVGQRRTLIVQGLGPAAHEDCPGRHRRRGDPTTARECRRRRKILGVLGEVG
jgi:alcohol dehydrogenase class IV